MKHLLSTTILALLISTQAFSQHNYIWDAAKLTIDLPFDPETAEIESDDQSLMFMLDELELEFLIISKDSVNKYYTDPWPELVGEIVDEFDIIQLSEPLPFPFTTEGSWITALDTIVFTDSLVIGALSHSSVDIVVLAVFDCYGFPLADAIKIMQSLRFTQSALKDED